VEEVLNGVKKAVCNLEGGGRPFLEGLGYSSHPCAEVLSVAVFLAFIFLFPGRKRLFPEGREVLFPAGLPTDVQHRG